MRRPCGQADPHQSRERSSFSFFATVRRSYATAGLVERTAHRLAEAGTCRLRGSPGLRIAGCYRQRCFRPTLPFPQTANSRRAIAHKSGLRVFLQRERRLPSSGWRVNHQRSEGSTTIGPRRGAKLPPRVRNRHIDGQALVCWRLACGAPPKSAERTASTPKSLVKAVREMNSFLARHSGRRATTARAGRRGQERSSYE